MPACSRNEVWCGDAVGHLYLFARSAANVWSCLYRSQDLGAFPGCYNNLFAIKDSEGITRRLLVRSPGYVMLFDVDPAALSFP